MVRKRKNLKLSKDRFKTNFKDKYKKFFKFVKALTLSLFFAIKFVCSKSDLRKDIFKN